MISSTDEWELTAGGMYHECYLKEAYTDDNTDANVDAASCMENKYVNWASSDAVWHGQSGPSANCNPPLENACSGLIGMDYGGNPSYTDSNGESVSCGYAPIVEIFADHADWQAPGWYGGAITYDASMDNPMECQARCFLNADCDFFSYEWELTADGMYHECYLKTSYTDDNTDADVDAASCMADPYVPWISEDPYWHGQSGPGIACARPTESACESKIGMGEHHRLPTTLSAGLCFQTCAALWCRLRRQPFVRRLCRQHRLVRLRSDRCHRRRPRGLASPGLVRRHCAARRHDGQPA